MNIATGTLPIASELLSLALPTKQTAHSTHCTPQQFQAALVRWRKLLGMEHVQVNAETLTRYAHSTLPTSTHPRAVLRPACTREVSELVKIASQYNLPLHPISRGKNWGYGSACAPGDGWVIVDLGRMNRILEVNEELAYAVIEPGVTQGQMYEYLQANCPGLMLDVTGAGPDASIVGNTLQRGFGHTPYGNHFTHQSGMEVVLNDGRVIRTGFGSQGEHAQCKHLFPWGQGPALDGLFTQSNLGLVTSMGVWLMPKPEVIEAFAFSVPGEEQLSGIVEKLRWLKLHDIVRSTVHIANDLRVISSQRSYPVELCNVVYPLPENIRMLLRKEHGIGAWNVMGGLYGTHGMVASAKQTVRKMFGELASVQFFSRRKLNVAKTLVTAARYFHFGQQLERKLASASSVYDLLCGIPSREHLRGSGWRQVNQTPEQAFDPGSTGLIWISPVIPATAKASGEVVALITESFQEYGFDPLITISTVTERANVVVSSIHFDLGQPTECQAAKQCELVTKQRLAARGYFPYRTGTM